MNVFMHKSFTLIIARNKTSVTSADYNKRGCVKSSPIFKTKTIIYMETVYDVDYYINHLKGIPEEKWCVSSFYDGYGYCVQGHFGMNAQNCMKIWSAKTINDIETKFHAVWHLINLFKHHSFVLWEVNNGVNTTYQQPTPKQRILAALYDIKKMQQPKYVDITKELAVLPQQETQDIIVKNVMV